MNSVSYNVEVLKRGNNEVYPMPFFVSLQVKDAAAATAWYRDVLGFVVMFSALGPGGQVMMSHIRWIKFADLMLIPAPSMPDAAGAGMKLNFQVWPEDIALDELAAQFQARGAEIVEGPVDRPWNTREFTVRDSDGYLLTFTQVDYARLSGSFDTTMEWLGR